jgi:RimJ/RimL family protein N-acetyltransferase
MERSQFLRGELVVLRSVDEADAPVVLSWMSDEVVTYYMFTGQRPMTSLQAAEELRRQTDSGSNTVFMVEDLKTRRPVGLAGLYDIHPAARKAEFRVLLGEKECWNKGYGTEVTELLTFYGFDRLNLNRIWLGVTAENRGGVRAYQKAGYREEGRLREDLYRNSRYYDSIRMSILRSEYYPDLYKKHAQRFRSGPPRPGEE